MGYLVKLATRAERDLADLYEYINAEFSDAARNWYWGLHDAILSLQEHPNRGSVFRRKDQLRQLFYGKPNAYRVIYRVLEHRKQVIVLHIRHGARRQPTPSDLPYWP